MALQSAGGDAKPAEFEKDSVRDRIVCTDSQLAQLDYEISRLEQALAPILVPCLNESTCKGDAPEPARSLVAQAVHEQGARVYAAHRRITELLSRVAL